MEEEFFERVMQVIVDTIDNYFGGYRIRDMENDILKQANDLYLTQHPEARLYEIVGEMDGEQMTFCSILCKPIAEVKLKMLTNCSPSSWKNFDIREKIF